MTRDDFLRVLVEHLPREFVWQLGPELGRVYLQAQADRRSNPLVGGPEAKVFEGFSRYTYACQRMRELAARCGLQTVNLSSGNHIFSVFIAGTIAFTVHRLRDDYYLPSANYREWLAALNDATDNPDLPFDGGAVTAALAAVKHYVVVHHSGDVTADGRVAVGFGRLRRDEVNLQLNLGLETVLAAFDVPVTPAATEIPDNVRPVPRRREREGGDRG